VKPYFARGCRNERFDWHNWRADVPINHHIGHNLCLEESKLLMWSWDLGLFRLSCCFWLCNLNSQPFTALSSVPLPHSTPHPPTHQQDLPGLYSSFPPIPHTTAFHPPYLTSSFIMIPLPPSPPPHPSPPHTPPLHVSFKILPLKFPPCFSDVILLSIFAPCVFTSFLSLSPLMESWCASEAEWHAVHFTSDARGAGSFNHHHCS
jgi:hypothetical protein